MKTNDFWPMSLEPRKTQTQTFDWIDKNKDAKYFILEAPVGAGKSNIGLTISRFITPNYGESFILTPQIILQQQYENTFRDNLNVDLASFYGKTNYQCTTKNVSCDAGQEIKPKCYNCPYDLAKKKAQTAHNTVMNYKLALTNFAYSATFLKARKLIILDECHNTEEQLIELDTIQITQYRCDKYKIPFIIPETIEEGVEYVENTYMPKILENFRELQNQVDQLRENNSGPLTAHESHKIKEYNSLKHHLNELEIFMTNKIDYIKEQFVLISDKTSFSFKRLFGMHAFNTILKPMGNQFLFMSGTILNKNSFCKDLGIDSKDAVFLSLPSEFPKENRPVIFMPQMKMNYEWKNPENKSGRDKLVKTIKKLLEIHKDESGIIHTANFVIATWLVDQLLEDETFHTIYHHNPNSKDKRVDVISQFLENKTPSILISPSITEGLDLKEDLGRFAIICKVPFGNLTDKWVKKRLDLSKEWYNRQALIDIIQGGGRIVRSAEDSGSVYILDQSFSYLYNQTKQMIPKWWQEAFTKFD